MRIEFKYGAKKYVVETKPLTIELYKKYVIGISSKAALLEKIDKLFEKAEELDDVEKLIAKKEEVEQEVVAMPAELGQVLTEAVSVDGNKVEGPLSAGEYTCIGTVIARLATPSEEDLKNLES